MIRVTFCSSAAQASDCGSLPVQHQAIFHATPQKLQPIAPHLQRQLAGCQVDKGLRQAGGREERGQQPVSKLHRFRQQLPAVGDTAAAARQEEGFQRWRTGKRGNGNLPTDVCNTLVQAAN